MTLAFRRGGIAFQLAGLAGSALGLTATFIARTSCLGPFYVGAALVAVALDLVALRAAPNTTAIVASLIKPLTILAVGMVLVSCRPVPLEFAPSLDPVIGPTLVLVSSIPSILGAILRRLSR